MAQRARINTEAVTPHRLTTLGLTTNSVSSGLNVVPNETFVYFSAENIGNTEPIISATFTFLSKPTGSTATLSALNPTFSFVKLDVKGTYEVKLSITTTSGSHDTTATFYSANYVGVGNYDNTPAVYPNCMSCHAATPKFIPIFDKWKISGHATKFKRGINGDPSYYGAGCFKCHTTGHNHDLVASNNGFDDVATAAGWVFYSPAGPTKWDSLKAKSSVLVQFANIGCEMCHGPGSEHALGGDKKKIAITFNAGVCGQCHDEPWRHNRYAQWENSHHSEPVWSNSFVRNFTDYGLNSCYRCHDGKAFVNFTKGIPFESSAAQGYSRTNQTAKTCQTCHDPHSMELRQAPASSDTLTGGFNYSSIEFGKGKVCVNCHKYRRDGPTYTATTRPTSLSYNGHYLGATDVILGKGANTYGYSIPNSVGHRLVENSCVGCHMSATTDTGTVARDKIGQHSWSMSYTDPATSITYDNVTGCVSCHSGITKFKDIIASYDYDGNGTTEAFMDEVEGLLKKLVKSLPPVGLDSISVALINASPDSLRLRQALFNYNYIKYGAAHGVHNPKYVVGLLQRSITTITGVEFSSPQVPANFDLAQNYPNPFNPSTEINFSVPKSENVKLAIYDATGKLVRVLVNEMLNPGNYKVNWNGDNSSGSRVVSGIYFYRLESSSYQATKKMVLLK